MPQVVAVMIAGAGLYAGWRWVSKALERAQDASRELHEEIIRAREAARVPKDLGSLEYDQEARVYRPRAR